MIKRSSRVSLNEEKLNPEPEVDHINLDEFTTELQNEPITTEMPYDQKQEEQEEEQEKQEIPEEVLESASEMVAVLLISTAQIMPYWVDKQKELEEKYGSMQEFQEKLRNHVFIAISGNKWLRSLFTKAEIWGNVLSIAPLMMTLYELFRPPQKESPKEEVSTKQEEEVVRNVENIPLINVSKSVSPGAYPI